MAYFIKEVNPRLAEQLLKFNGSLAKHGLTSKVWQVYQNVDNLGFDISYCHSPGASKIALKIYFLQVLL